MFVQLRNKSYGTKKIQRKSCLKKLGQLAENQGVTHREKYFEQNHFKKNLQGLKISQTETMSCMLCMGQCYAN